VVAAVALSCDIIAMITDFSFPSVLFDSISSGGWVGRPIWGRMSRSSCTLLHTLAEFPTVFTALS